jgi:acetoacetyl-CoA reductase
MGGLGEAICIKLAALGYQVVTTHSPGNTKVAAWLKGMTNLGYGFRAYPCDVTDYDSCRDCVAAVSSEVGPVDVLVNNAGITRDMTFKKMTKGDWDAVISTNLDSVFNMCKQVLDGMTERKWGRVINVSSVNGQKGAFGQSNYSAAKAGMHGFTKALALEVARQGVTVNTISPGYIGTKMVTAIPQEILDSKILPLIPVNRLGKPEEIAGLVAYLASDEAAFVTGANISINGGQHMF